MTLRPIRRALRARRIQRLNHERDAARTDYELARARGDTQGQHAAHERARRACHELMELEVSR